MDRLVSISQSRCLSFQGAAVRHWGNPHGVSISQSRCLSFQGIFGRVSRAHDTFQSRNRDACHFRPAVDVLIVRIKSVSISQSRCLSFQVPDVLLRGESPALVEFQSRNRDACHFRIDKVDHINVNICCFNLAIEMLVISGSATAFTRRDADSMFQSRNRDACHFRPPQNLQHPASAPSFQSRNRDACHFRRVSDHDSQMNHQLFQSRNRDACHFRSAELRLVRRCRIVFQSRNRDACHFRSLPAEPLIRFV